MAAPNQKADAAAPAEKKKGAKKSAKTEGDDFNYIVRMANTDIDGLKYTVIGLQSIKGVGKRVSQIIAKKANVDPAAKIGSLTDEQVREAVEMFSRHQDYADVSEEKRGSYLREYTALLEYIEAKQ